MLIFFLRLIKGTHQLWLVGQDNHDNRDNHDSHDNHDWYVTPIYISINTDKCKDMFISVYILIDKMQNVWNLIVQLRQCFNRWNFSYRICYWESFTECRLDVK